MTYGFYASLILANCLLLVSFLVGTSNRQLKFRNNIKWYVGYLGFALVVELCLKIFILIIEVKSISFVYPFYIAGEFYILLRFLFIPLKWNKKWNYLIGLISLLIFIEASYLWYHEHQYASVFGKAFSHISIIALSGFLLIKRIKESNEHQPFAIIYSALFLYYSVSLILFLLMNQLTETNIVIWTMNNLLSSMLYGASFYTFQKLKKSY
jgi:hypothetical protein